MVPRFYIFALTLLAFAGATLSACQPRPRTWQGSDEKAELPGAASPSKTFGFSGEIAELDLSRGLPELPAPTLLGGPPSGSYFQLVSALRGAIEGSETKAFFVRLGSVNIGWARAEELGRMLIEAREANKPVICHAEGYSNTTAWMAARGCERIWLSPAGSVETTGIAAQVLYANRLLTEKLGVKVDMLQVGRFKGADETFTRDGPSPEARESLESTLSAIRETWLTGFGERGKVIEGAVEDGPHGPEEALRLGLIDGIGYADEARDEARDRGGSPVSRTRFGPASDRRSGFAEVLRALSGGGGTPVRRPHVAVVRAIGAITMERSGGLFGGSGGISQRSLGRTIRDLMEDDSTKAVVLRIDSPGGSALASDLLWHELMSLRDQKPLVVSIGDMAASGGYYLASAADKIIAEKTSIIGSIGVVGGKLAFGEALEPLGINVETFSPNPRPGGAARAAYESAFTAWDPATRERVRGVMESIYSLFVRRVATGRGVSVEQIAPATEGRLFAGEAAMRLGLVDEWGGVERAIELAKDLASLRPDAPVRLISERGGLLDWLALDEGAGEEGEVAKISAPTDLKADALRSIAPELSAFLASAEPLLQGERALAALPFAIFLR